MERTCRIMETEKYTDEYKKWGDGHYGGLKGGEKNVSTDPIGPFRGPYLK